HPLVFALFVPLLLIYYLNAGVKHRALLWHLGLWSGQVVALAINYFWLQEWLVHWWIRSPPLPGTELLNHRTFRSFWNAPIWGVAADRALAVALIIGSLLGLIFFHRQKKQRNTGRLLLLGGGVLLTLALLGISWEPLGRIGASSLIVPALL